MPYMGDLSHQLRRALARAGDGKALSVDETEALLSARGERLLDLLGIAARLRELGHGTTVTYSRKVFIPLTMLCRDHCHYCTFAKPPARLDAPFLSPEEVVAIADAGRKLGCKEALFTLGDRPEDRYPEARAWLEERGYRSTLDYVRAMAITVIEETGLLPHLNPGVMSYEELARLKHVSASMGLMLETSSDRLSRKGGPHFGSPDKVPAVRLRTIEDAGRLAIPFTTGVLVGIGETPRELLVGHDAGIQVRQQPRLLDHPDGDRADVVQRRRVPALGEPLARDLVPVLRPVAEREQRLLAAEPAPALGDRDRLLRRQERCVEAGGGLGERAVVAVIPAEHRERHEDFARVGDRPAVPQLA